MSVQEFIDYIDKAFDRTPYTAYWYNEKGEELCTDVGYAEEWWYKGMRPELLRVFGGEADDRP